VEEESKGEVNGDVHDIMNEPESSPDKPDSEKEMTTNEPAEVMETETFEIGGEEPPTQEELDNPFVDFKYKKSVPFFSFCDPKMFDIDPTAPLPKYLTNEEVFK
jgi:hypothetical protein